MVTDHALQTKVDAFETGGRIVEKLSRLQGNNRLPASAVRDIPTGSGNGDGITTDEATALIKPPARVGSTARWSGNDVDSVSSSQPGVLSENDYVKLEGIETGATADQTAAEIKTKYESNADTNAFTDAEKTKLGGLNNAPAGVASELESVSTLPAATGTTGRLVNYNGVLYELLEGTEDPHVYRGTVASRTGGFVGDDVVQWQGSSPEAIKIKLKKSVLGATAPSPLFIEVNIPSVGIHVESEISHNAVDDDSDDYGYIRTTGQASIPAPDEIIGKPFSVAFYTDESKTNEQNVHDTGEKKWERDDRNEVNVDPKFLAGNSERLGRDKVPDDTVYDADLAIVTVWTGNATAFAAQTRAAGNKTLYVVTP